MEKRCALVIEDNDLNRKLFCSLLELGEYEALGAVDAETGIVLAREHHPRLILMDIQLPGMDGLSATRLIKTDPDLKDIMVVALTAYAMPGDEERALGAGCSGYLTKPIDTRTFLEAISRFMNS